MFKKKTRKEKKQKKKKQKQRKQNKKQTKQKQKKEKKKKKKQVFKRRRNNKMPYLANNVYTSRAELQYYSKLLIIYAQ